VTVFSENPVLIKEVRGRLRARRQGRANQIAAYSVIGLVAFLLYFFGLRSLLFGDARANGEGLFLFYRLFIEMLIALFMTPAIAASSITKEREQQTWNALLLSRLTTAEIVIGKYVAALLPTFLVLFLFFPLVLIASAVGQVGVARYVGSTLCLGVTVAFYGALSLFWSWACRRTFVATAFSFASVMFFSLGTLLIWVLVSVAATDRSMSPFDFFLNWLNPWVAMIALTDNNPRYFFVGVVYMIACLLATLILLLVLIQRLPHGAKELEQ
jgi:ABC-type transport system involved in multi-copper enzyme maturation permease subunit